MNRKYVLSLSRGVSNFVSILLLGCNKVIIKVNAQNNINTGTQVVTINIVTNISAVVNSEGYVATPGVGSHKLHTDSLTWNDARRTCIQEGGNKNNLRSATNVTMIISH